MNFLDQNVTTFPPQVNYTQPVVTTLPPIITRRVNVIHRFNIVNQPHILEDITQICNHCIKRHQCCTRPMCFEHTDYQEEGCCGFQNPCCSNQTFLGGSDFVNRPSCQQNMTNEGDFRR